VRVNEAVFRGFPEQPRPPYPPKKSLVWEEAPTDGIIPPPRKPGAILWVRGVPSSLPTHGVVEVLTQFAWPPVSPLRVRIDTDRGAAPECEVPFSGPPLRIVGANFDRSFEHLYVYVQNRGNEKALPVERVGILRRKRTGAPAGNVVGPGETACFRIDTPGTLRGQRVFPFVRLADGTTVAFRVHAFSGFPFVVNGNAGPTAPPALDGLRAVEFLGKYSRYCGWLDEVAARSIHGLDGLADRGTADGSLPMSTIQQGLWPIALPYVGKLLPAVHIYCDATDEAKIGLDASGRTFRQAKALYARTMTVPNRCWLGMRMYQGYGRCQRPMTPQELRLYAYDLLSSGSKGIHFRSNSWKEPPGSGLKEACARELRRIRTEILTLRPLLTVAEPVDGLATCSEPLVRPAVLLAGDKAIVVILLNQDRAPAWPRGFKFSKAPFRLTPKPDLFRVTLRIPHGRKLTSVTDVGAAALVDVPFERLDDGAVRFACNGLTATRQYVAAFDASVSGQLREEFRKSLSSGTGVEQDDVLGELVDDLTAGAGPAARVSDAGTSANAKTVAQPDIQVWPKQVYFGHVDPVEEAVVRKVKVRNAGTVPLHVALESVFVRDLYGDLHSSKAVSVRPRTLDVAPGKEAELTFRLAPRELPDARGGMPIWRVAWRTVFHTNDPNEREVWIESGAAIESQVLMDRKELSFEAGKPRTDVLLVGKPDWDLEIEKVTSSVPGLKWEKRTKDTQFILRYSDPFEMVRKERQVSLILSYAKPFPLSQKLEGEVVIETNDRLHKQYRLPVVILPRWRIELLPENVFLGLVREGGTGRGRCNLKSTLPIRIQDVTVDDPSVKVTTKALSEDSAQLDLQVISPRKSGLHHAQVKIKLKAGTTPRTVVVNVSYFAAGGGGRK